MSNVIKAYTVRYEMEAKKTIENHTKDFEILAKRNLKAVQQDVESGFVEGLKAVIVEALPQEEDPKEQASKIIEDARKEADNILKEAKNQAFKLKEETREAARKTGYEEGLKNGRLEVEKQLRQLEEKERMLQEQYETVLTGLEPQIADLMADLIVKLTGIVVEDQRELILYLVEKALSGIDKAEEYTIHVSREDFETISSRKEFLSGIAGQEIQIVESPELSKNQCRIDAGVKVIDCSLDVQLTNLVTDLKMLADI